MKDEQKTTETFNNTRRNFLQKSLLLTGVALAGGVSLLAKDKKDADDNVTANEDLMREHGVLNRILLIYDHIIIQLDKGQDFPVEALNDSATAIRKFVEDYHEKAEENYIFSRFRKANKHVALVDTLLAQHNAGRKLTDQILAYAKMPKITVDTDRKNLMRALTTFNYMYRPHESREDTVLFPALHKIISKHEYDALGEEMEKNEQKTFGQDGFDLYLSKVEAIEKKLGLYDLNQFTPKV